MIMISRKKFFPYNLVNAANLSTNSDIKSPLEIPVAVGIL